jgi:hypothetical protein
MHCRYVLAALFVTLTAAPFGRAQNPIQTENAQAGTSGWQLNNPATNREIEGYASLISLRTVNNLPGQRQDTPAGMRPLPDPLYGVTLDDVSDLSEIVTSLQALPRMTTARIVFAENTTPADYAEAVKTLQPVAYLMGEILDSEYVNSISVSQYSARTRQFLQAFGSQVDLWEVGNEVNGEWLGATLDVVAKISGAYSQVSAAGKRSALTLYYNPNCWSSQSNEMIPWTQKNIPAAMKNGLNYVLISYYEGDCNNYRPSAAELTQVFEQLHQIFPNAKLGFGEVGLANPVRGRTMTKAKSILNYYYGLKINVPGYIGGGFWWYGAEDLVPRTKPLWPSFANAIQNAGY